MDETPEDKPYWDDHTVPELARQTVKYLDREPAERAAVAEILDKLENLCMSVPLARANGLRAEFLNELRSQLPD
jgi:hypothetical protein